MSGTAPVAEAPAPASAPAPPEAPVADFNNFVPDSVRRQAERSEQLQRDLRAQADATTVGKPPEGGTEVQLEPGQPTQVVEPKSEPVVDDAIWKQRHDTLQGKYNAEVPALNRQVRELSSQVQSLNTILANLQSQPKPEPTPAPAARKQVEVPKEDTEAFGSELIDAARRWARAEVSGELEELRTQVASVQQNAQRAQSSVAQQNVERVLDQQVPNWRTVNNEPEFLDWLRQVDPFSGQVRHDMLGVAYRNGDAARTAAFFNAFIAEHTVTGQPQRQPAHTPDAGAGRPTLESMAAPGRATGQGSNGAPREARLWSPPEITAFYRDVNRGAYAGREAEKLRLERDIIAATTEGRVR